MSLAAAIRSRRFMAAMAILLAACAVALALSPDRSPAASKKPNVVVILADDMRYDDLEWMPKTEELLGSKGTTFEKHMFSFPLCCPSRTSMLTGQLAHNHGVDGNFPPSGYHEMTPSFKRNMLQGWLQKAGYTTSHIGKYLNGYGDINQKEVPPGWSDWHGTVDQTSYDFFNTLINDNGKVNRYGDKTWIDKIMVASKYIGQNKVENFADFVQLLGNTIRNGTDPNNLGTSDHSKYLVDTLSDRAVSFIKRSKKSKKPFYLELATPAPHKEDLSEQANYRGINPRVPPRYEDDVAGLTAPTDAPSFDIEPSDKGSLLRSNFGASISTRSGTQPGFASTAMLNDYYRGRAGSLMALDDGVERVVNQLKASGKLGNTLIIFTSDNGWMMGEHRIVGDKYVPYEESIRGPLIIKGPGIPAGQTIDSLTSNVDIATTVAAAARVKPKRVQDGISLLSVAKTGNNPRTVVPLEATRALFVKDGFPYTYDKAYYGVRTANWKYFKWSVGTHTEELYDLASDPFELTNLAEDPDYSAKLDEMRALAERLKGCKGSACWH